MGETEVVGPPEPDDGPMLQNGRFIDPLPVHINVRIPGGRGQSDNLFRARDHTMPGS